MEPLGRYPAVHKEKASAKRGKKKRALTRVANHLCPPPREKCARDLVEELRMVAGTDPLAWREFSFQTARMAPLNFQEALDCASIQLEAICIMRDFIQEHANSSQDLTKRKYRTLFQADTSADANAASQPASPKAKSMDPMRNTFHGSPSKQRSASVKGKGKGKGGKGGSSVLTRGASLGAEDRDK